jgi:hypothetical protein
MGHKRERGETSLKISKMIFPKERDSESVW